AREAARRTQCINNQKNLGIGLSSYATNNNGLPGYLNQLGKYADGTTPRILSWVVAVFPEIEENKRYEFLTKDTLVSTEVAQAIESSPPVLICPSAYLQQHSDNTPILSYVVNCGPETHSGNGINGDVTPTFTLFKDRRGTLTSINKKVKLDEIVDGTSYTILLSENMQAWTWYHTDTDITLCDELPTTAASPISTRLLSAVASLGFVWSNQPSSTAFYSKINTPLEDPLTAQPPNMAKARPSSKHPGIVVALYGDGSAKTINDDCGLGPYLSAVCPNDTKASQTVSDGGLGYDADDFRKPTW
ncbi:MAG: DUF1559 domain-containing protein, partial [Planctomycetaceae bacterium]|nr:DUF1559 domain-containing protein [Planctomycetaceae bacterium]